MSLQQYPPRQRMINMMYLVLTAILALNVSGEVLEAFQRVNESLQQSENMLEFRNDELYTRLQNEFERDSIKTRDVWNKAQNARMLTQNFCRYVDSLKRQLATEAGGIDPETGFIKRSDDLEASTRMFVEGNSAIGEQLRNRILKYRSDLLALTPFDEKSKMDKTLAMQPPTKKDWVMASFNQVPAVAAATNLTTLMHEARSSENQVVELLIGSVDKQMNKVDRMQAGVLSPSSYVMEGEQYNAEVLVSAYSSTQHPEVYLGKILPGVITANGVPYHSESPTPPVRNPQMVATNGGKGVLKLSGAVGDHQYEGVVKVQNPVSGWDYYPFKGNYKVGKKEAVVSPKKMNVLYVGLDNPIDISVPGVPSSDVKVSIDNGRLVKMADGTMMAQVVSPGRATVKVEAVINGRTSLMGVQEFRVKRIPTPQSTVDGVTQGGNVAKQFIAQRMSVVPKLDDFVYDVPFEVVSFVCSTRKGDEIAKADNQGPVFNEKVRSMLKSLKGGDAFFIDDITVRFPNREIRKIAPIAFQVNR